jgi:hypothetical protein
MLGNIRHWLENEEEIAELSRQIFDIRREDICRAKDRQNQRNNH